MGISRGVIDAGHSEAQENFAFVEEVHRIRLTGHV